jgi:hypothetical protein
VQLGLEDESIKDIAVYNSLIFVVNSDSGKLYRSTDNGINWSTIFEWGVIDVEISPQGDVYMLIDSLCNSIHKQLFISSDGGYSWTYLDGIDQICFDTIPGVFCGGFYNVKIIQVGTIFCEYAISGRGGGNTTVAMSTDNGLSWSPTFVTGGEIYDFRGNSIITSGNAWEPTTGYDEIYFSDDGGIQWTSLGYPPFSVGALKLCTNGNILAGGNFVGIFLSEDTCGSWVQVSSLIPSAGLSIESGGWVVGNDSLGVFMFSDNGDSLGSRNDGLTNLTIHTLTVDNNNFVYTGTENGVWRRSLFEILPVELTSFTATSNGKEVTLNWSTATEINNLGFEIQRSIERDEFFTIGFVNGHGTTTEQHNYSYADKNLDNGKYFYRLKQVDYNGTYEYSDVVEVEWRAFSSYLLEQNYPNPFNPTTTIGFGLQNKSNVKIIILNAIGEEVAIIMNEEREPGFHQVEFNAVSLPSGVYFYQLRAGDYVNTKKMILLK